MTDKYKINTIFVKTGGGFNTSIVKYPSINKLCFHSLCYKLYGLICSDQRCGGVF